MQCASEGVGSVVGMEVVACGCESGAVYADVVGEFGVGVVFGFDECVEVCAVFVGQCIGVPGGVVEPVEVWVNPPGRSGMGMSSGMMMDMRSEGRFICRQ